MIEVEDLSKYYGDRPAVLGASFSIHDGEVVGFLGLNGAGKTTLLRMLAGDLSPSGGRIVISGDDLARRPRDLGRKVGFLPERPPLYPEMLVRDYLVYLARLRGVRRADADRAASDAMTATGLAGMGRERVEHLSHGFRKRLGIAQALVHSPALVIMDEPTAGLDPMQNAEMMRLVRNLAGERTVLISSHHLAEIGGICDRLLVMLDGRVAAMGTREELVAQVEAVSAIEVEARAGADDLVGALKSVPGVSSVEAVLSSGGVTKCLVRAGSDVRPALARAVMDSGYDLLALQKKTGDLEAVFEVLHSGEVGHA